MDLPLWIILSFGVPSYLFALYILNRCRKEGSYAVLSFLVIVVYAVFIEGYDVRHMHSYFYRDVLIMVGRFPDWVPLSICMSWGVLIYIAMKSTDMLGLPWQQRPLVDGLIAVSVDFVSDPVMSSSSWVGTVGERCYENTEFFGGLGIWTWCVPRGYEDAVWVTVPLGNFFAWYMVVAVISYALRFGRQRLGGAERGLMTQILLVLALAAAASVVVLGFVYAWAFLQTGTWTDWLLMGAPLLLAVVILIRARGSLHMRNPLDIGLVIAPLASYFGALATFFTMRMDPDHWPTALIALIVAALASACLVFLPYLGRWLGRGEAQA